MTQVLVIDDDEQTRTYLRYLLEDEGYRVAEADNGHEGLRIMRETASHLVVLLDYLMPEFNGFDVLRAVHADPGLLQRHSVIIITSYYGRIKPFELARFMTAADIPLLRKPFDYDQVLEEVAEASQRLVLFS
jgi:CheY-like chemotaxis protein